MRETQKTHYGDKWALYKHPEYLEVEDRETGASYRMLFNQNGRMIVKPSAAYAPGKERFLVSLDGDKLPFKAPTRNSERHTDLVLRQGRERKSNQYAMMIIHEETGIVYSFRRQSGSDPVILDKDHEVVAHVRRNGDVKVNI